MVELELGGETFQCRNELPAGPLMKLAKSQKADEMGQVAGMLDFVMGLLVTEERDRFSAFLDDSDATFDEWNQAVGKLMETYAGRPTRRPSLSPPGPSTTGGSSNPDSSSPGTDRVVNLSRRAG